MIGKRSGFSEFVLLGHGGQGVVYRAREIALDRLVVLKSLPYAGRKEKLGIMARAGRLASLSFPGVPKILRVVCSHGAVWLVMEYVEGISMAAQRVREWSEPLRLTIALRAAEILSAIHQAGWMHGDIKPSNILLARDGTIHIIDMGFARQNCLGMTGNPVGTLAYMAPEVKLGSVKDPIRADIYSFGVLLHELFKGALPMRASSNCAAPVGAIDTVIARCCHINPLERFESAQALKNEFAALSQESEDAVRERLKALIQPLVNEHFHHCCLASARGSLTKKNEEAYHLICEALEWNPDSSEALLMLQQIRPRARQRRVALIVAAAGSLIALGIPLMVFQSNHRPPAPVVLCAALAEGNEYLVPASRPLSVSERPVLPLRSGLQDTRFEARITLRGITAGLKLFCDDKPLACESSIVTVAISSGKHLLYATDSTGIVWRQRVETLPFETLYLRVTKNGMD